MKQLDIFGNLIDIETISEEEHKLKHLGYRRSNTISFCWSGNYNHQRSIENGQNIKKKEGIKK